uniref:Uncharacterized protein n=1 Tax=Aegilops tauschii TaxID=37682 RepID=M8B4F8_AEGTA
MARRWELLKRPFMAAAVEVPKKEDAGGADEAAVCKRALLLVLGFWLEEELGPAGASGASAPTREELLWSWTKATARTKDDGVAARTELRENRGWSGSFCSGEDPAGFEPERGMGRGEGGGRLGGSGRGDPQGDLVEWRRRGTNLLEFRVWSDLVWGWTIYMKKRGVWIIRSKSDGR